MIPDFVIAKLGGWFVLEFEYTAGYLASPRLGVGTFSMNVCHKRLQKEYISLKQQPVDNIEAVPNDRNILEWHYVVIGPKDTV